MLALKLRDVPTNGEIEMWAAENPGIRFERDADGMLVVSPTFSMGGLHDSRFNLALGLWNRGLSEPGYCFGSSTGFTLSDGSLISPDAAWITPERWHALTEEQQNSYAPITPDIVVEIASQTDRPGRLRAKLERCRRLGAHYVLLLDPYRNSIWSDGMPPAGLHLRLETIA